MNTQHFTALEGPACAQDLADPFVLNAADGQPMLAGGVGDCEKWLSSHLQSKLKCLAPLCCGLNLSIPDNQQPWEEQPFIKEGRNMQELWENVLLVGHDSSFITVVEGWRSQNADLKKENLFKFI